MKQKTRRSKELLTIKDMYGRINNLADQAWGLVQFWSVFSQTIIGNQLITSLDKASITLAKAGRSSNQSKVTDYLDETLEYIMESLLWSDKARRRKLFNNQDYQNIYTELRAFETSITLQLSAKKLI